MGAGADYIDLVKIQLPYMLAVVGITSVLYFLERWLSKSGQVA